MQFQCFVSPLVKALQYQLSVCTSSTTRTAGGAARNLVLTAVTVGKT